MLDERSTGYGTRTSIGTLHSHPLVVVDADWGQKDRMKALLRGCVDQRLGTARHDAAAM